MAPPKPLQMGTTLLWLLVLALFGLAGSVLPNPAGPPAGDNGSRPSHDSLPSSAKSEVLPLRTAPVPQPRPPTIHHSRNWAGGANARPPVGTRFAAAKMNMTLPTSLGIDIMRPDANAYAANAWVGIDGWNRAGLLQAGVTFEVNKSVSGELAFQAWYEWTPDRAKFIDIAIGPGDKIEVEVVMFNATRGKVYLGNLSSGEWVSRVLNAPQPASALVGATVEWIVEDFRLVWEPDNMAFGDFGAIELQDCVAYTSDGDEVGPDPGELFWIQQGNLTRARTTVEGSSVTVEYNRRRLIQDNPGQHCSSNEDWSDADSLDLPLYTAGSKSGVDRSLSRSYGGWLLALVGLAFVSTWALTIASAWRIAWEQSRASCSAAVACPVVTGAHVGAASHGSNGHHHDHQVQHHPAGEGRLHLPGWRLIYNSSYCNGIKDPEGARARGCIFDPVQTGWMHGRCVDKELTEEFINSHQWEWYDDEPLTKPTTQNTVLRGFGNRDAFTIDDYHYHHCEYIMKALIRNVIRQPSAIGFKALDEEHLEHCLDRLINYNTPELRNAWTEHLMWTGSGECYERVGQSPSS
ncbi:concanavalin A-like lectin/glucanase [Colletotrichum caudatum]|nr:concanavalin A-like lectin/glucanase [Colletotrichum caudatum]